MVTSKIPVFDFLKLPNTNNESPIPCKIVKGVEKAMSRFGAFQIINHNIPDQTFGTIKGLAKDFFSLPYKEKEKLIRTQDNSRGYFAQELTKNKRDKKEHFEIGALKHPTLRDDHPLNVDPIEGFNLWPTQVPKLRTTMLDYFEACEALSLTILGIYSLILGKPEGYLGELLNNNNNSWARLNHYTAYDPMNIEDKGDFGNDEMGLNEHTDDGIITLLWQDDVGGLQLLVKNKWIDVPPTKGAIVVNTGDIMQILSNNKYKAVVHRVLPVQEGDRISIPYFFNPDYDFVAHPVTSKGETPKFRPVKWADFRRERIKGDFADYGQEIQILDYKI